MKKCIVCDKELDPLESKNICLRCRKDDGKPIVRTDYTPLVKVILIVIGVITLYVLFPDFVVYILMTAFIFGLAMSLNRK